MRPIPAANLNAERSDWIEWISSEYFSGFLCWSGEKLVGFCKEPFSNLSDAARLEEMRVSREKLKQLLSLETLGEDTDGSIQEALNSYLSNGRALIKTGKLDPEEFQKELIKLKTFSELTGYENVAQILSEWIKQLGLLLAKKESKQGGQESQTNLKLSECASEALPLSKERQSVLKTNHYLLAATAQLELQNQLTQACYDSDIDKVRDLIEKKFADPFIPDQDGQQPMAAAIWGLSLEVVGYLETKATLSFSDWISIAEFLQNKYGQVVLSAPTERKETAVYQCSNWGCDKREIVTSISIEKASWVNSDEAIKRRGCDVALNQRLEQIRNCELGLSGWQDPARASERNQARNQITKDKAQVISEFMPWFSERREVMISRLEDKGLVISEDNQLIIEVQREPESESELESESTYGLADNDMDKTQTSGSAGQLEPWITGLYRQSINWFSGWWNSVPKITEHPTSVSEEKIIAQKEVIEKAFSKAESKIERMLLILELSESANKEKLTEECLHYKKEIARYHKEEFIVSAIDLEKLDCVLNKLLGKVCPAPHLFVSARLESMYSAGFFNSMPNSYITPVIAPVDISRLEF